MRADAIARDSVVEAVQALPVRQNILCSGNTFIIRVSLNNGRVREAWSSGKMMRNMNVLLQGGLDDNGLPKFTQQAHCLCNDGHALAAVRALENLADVAVPRNALLVRSLVQALRGIQEHLLHVYQLHLSDWASTDAALCADPAEAARLAEEQDADSFRQTQERLKSLSCGQCQGLFGNGSPEHPDYGGTDAMHLALHTHGFHSLRIRSVIDTALGLLGFGSNGCRAYQLGGLPQDLDLSPEVRNRLRGLLRDCLKFVRTTFLPDLQRLARTYAHWSHCGAVNALLSWGDYLQPHSTDNCSQLLPGGVVMPTCRRSENDCAWTTRPLQPDSIREIKEPIWTGLDCRRYRLRANGVDDSEPVFQWGKGAFGWLTAPRHGAEACETGALARILAAWTQNSEPVCAVMRETLQNTGLCESDLNSTLGRVLARGMESVVLSQACTDWLDELDASLSGKDTRLRTEIRLPDSGLGIGRVEVPRGTLTHSIRLENGRIASHTYLIPSMWNFSPRDSNNTRGPLEQALLGTPVSDPEHPLEVLRTIHELDPCNAFHLVVEDAATGRTIVLQNS